jgi:hypothetical protein
MQTAQELRSHYRAVRERLWSARPAPRQQQFHPREKTGWKLIYKWPAGPFHIVDMTILDKQREFIKVRQIVNEVREKHGLTEEQLVSENRQRHLIACRQEIYWRLSRETVWSLSRIGHYMNRDHTTIIWGIRKHEERLRNAAK